MSPFVKVMLYSGSALSCEKPRHAWRSVNIWTVSWFYRSAVCVCRCMPGTDPGVCWPCRTTCSPQLVFAHIDISEVSRSVMLTWDVKTSQIYWMKEGKKTGELLVKWPLKLFFNCLLNAMRVSRGPLVGWGGTAGVLDLTFCTKTNCMLVAPVECLNWCVFPHAINKMFSFVWAHWTSDFKRRGLLAYLWHHK